MIRNRIEDWFAILTEWIYQRKFITLGCVLLLTALIAVQIKDIRFDTRDESFFHEDDPTLVAYNQFRDTFGQDDIFIIAMRPESGLNQSFLSTLHQLHKKLETGVPYLDDIQSLVNGRIVRAEGDTLHVEELMPSVPQNKDDVSRVLSLIDRYPMYEDVIVSSDRSVACIIIKAKAIIEVEQEDIVSGFDTGHELSDDAQRIYLSNAQNVEITNAIENIISEYRGRGIEIYLSGTPVFVAAFEEAIQKDLGVMMPLSMLIVVVFLSLLFRRISGVAFPLTVVILSLLSSFGIMALMDVPITHVIQILPTFLIVVGIGDSVHILTIFYRIYRDTGDKKSSIVKAVRFSGLPVLMTSVTTSCGLLSFCWADLASVAQLGFVAPVGVMLAFFYTVVLLPALIAIFPMRKHKPVKSNGQTISDRLFAAISRATCRYPLSVIAISSILLISAAYLASSVKLSHNAMTWFPEKDPVRVATDFLNEVNGGTLMLEVTVDTGKENGVHEPVLIKGLDESAQAIADMRVNGIQAGKVWSIGDVIKEINRALNEGQSAAYTIPDKRDAIAQELLLFESSGSDDMEDFTDSTYQTARLSILAPFTDAILYKDYVDTIESYLAERFSDFKVQLTGHVSLFVQITKNFITSMIKSYGIALMVITLLMVLMIGRIRVGLMSMVANVGPIVCIFGVMGALDIPLDLATILIGSIVLGLVVDDTIHFLHHFRRAFDHTGDVEAAVYETLSTTGRALIITSLVLAGGFFIYTASYLANNIRFGLLSGTAVLVALGADFFLVPALLKVIYGRQQKTVPAQPQPDRVASKVGGSHKPPNFSDIAEDGQ